MGGGTAVNGGKVVVASLDCWHANELIYQADGRLDDGRHCYVHFRGDRFSVWVGERPVDDHDDNPGEWIIEAERHPEGDPSKITRATLEAWSGGRIEWPARIDGYHNEPEGAPGQGPVPLGEGGV